MHWRVTLSVVALALVVSLGSSGAQPKRQSVVPKWKVDFHGSITRKEIRPAVQGSIDIDEAVGVTGSAAGSGEYGGKMTLTGTCDAEVAFTGVHHVALLGDFKENYSGNDPRAAVRIVMNAGPPAARSKDVPPAPLIWSGTGTIAVKAKGKGVYTYKEHVEWMDPNWTTAFKFEVVLNPKTVTFTLLGENAEGQMTGAVTKTP